MNLVRDILSAYRSPRKAIRRQLDEGIREEQSLFYALLFGLMNFISQLPNMAKQSVLSEQTLAGLAAQQFVASVFMMPLMLYIIASIAHFVMRAVKGRATYSEARRALFWAALVCVPFVLLLGIVSAFFDMKITLIISTLTLLVFCWQWASCLTETEFPQKPKDGV